MQKNKGISLIVLVITIIVMIILAGSIIITLSNSGIINKANEAVDLTNDKQMQEYITSELILNGWYSGKPITKELLDEIDGVTVTEAKVGDKVVPGTWIVEKDGAKTTIYETGDIVKGEVEIWDGTSVEVPEIKEGNWYIYTPAQFKFFAGYVNNVYEKDNNQTVTLTAEQMAQVPEITVDTYVYLMADLDLGARQENGAKTVGTAWIPIGLADDPVDENNNPIKQYKFRGTFEGNNHTIRGVYVSRDSNFGGIFGNSNTIKNLTIKGSYIKAANCAGGIVAALRIGNIENCHNVYTEVITSGYGVGGVVGQFTGEKIYNCTNTGYIICEGTFTDGTSQLGGIVGRYTGGSLIENCNNTGKLDAAGGAVGGIVGYMQNLKANATIVNCINSGNISKAVKAVGGIIGKTLSALNITSCKNNGKIIGAERVGGIIGDSHGNLKITKCVNANQVEGKLGVGGLAGTLGGVIEKCYNIGNVKLKSDKEGSVGGVVGVTLYNSKGSLVTSVIRNTYNLGTVIAEGNGIKYVGGIVGILSAGNVNVTINNNYNIGKIQRIGTGTDKIGGVLGSISDVENPEGTFNVNNNYYMQGIIETDGGNSIAKTSAEMKTEDFVKDLNKGLDTAAWEIRAGQNSGYPVLIVLK